MPERTEFDSSKKLGWVFALKFSEWFLRLNLSKFIKQLLSFNIGCTTIRLLTINKTNKKLITLYAKLPVNERNIWMPLEWKKKKKSRRHTSSKKKGIGAQGPSLEKNKCMLSLEEIFNNFYYKILYSYPFIGDYYINTML